MLECAEKYAICKIRKLRALQKPIAINSMYGYVAHQLLRPPPQYMMWESVMKYIVQHHR